MNNSVDATCSCFSHAFRILFLQANSWEIFIPKQYYAPQFAKLFYIHKSMELFNASLYVENINSMPEKLMMLLLL